MKKWLVLLIVSCSALATPKEELLARLTMTQGFSAKFEQIVKDADGLVLSEGTGRVDIRRPSLFRWETLAPDENLIVSDGTTVWYYSPFIEQVSIYNQDQTTAQTPFVLLTRNDPNDWQRYDVAQEGDVFTLRNVAVDSNQGTYHIVIDDKGQVRAFDVREQDGQVTHFVFSQVNAKTPGKAMFTFKVPEGVEIDDQRN